MLLIKQRWFSSICGTLIGIENEDGSCRTDREEQVVLDIVCNRYNRRTNREEADKKVKIIVKEDMDMRDKTNMVLYRKCHRRERTQNYFFLVCLVVK